MRGNAWSKCGKIEGSLGEVVHILVIPPWHRDSQVWSPSHEADPHCIESNPCSIISMLPGTLIRPPPLATVRLCKWVLFWA